MKNKVKVNKLVEEAASQWLQIVLMNIKHNKLHKEMADKSNSKTKRL